MSFQKTDLKGEKNFFDPLANSPTEVGQKTKNASGRGVYGTLTAVKGGQITTLVLHGKVVQVNRTVLHQEGTVISTREAYLELLEAAKEPMSKQAKAMKFALRAYYRFSLPFADRRGLMEIVRTEQYLIGLEDSEFLKQAITTHPGNDILRFMQIKGRVSSHRNDLEKYRENNSRRTKEINDKYGPLPVPKWEEAQTKVTWEEAIRLERAYNDAIQRVGAAPTLEPDLKVYEVVYSDGTKQVPVSSDLKMLFNPVTLQDTVRAWKIGSASTTGSSFVGNFDPNEFDGIDITVGNAPARVGAGATWSEVASGPTPRSQLVSENPRYSGPPASSNDAVKVSQFKDWADDLPEKDEEEESEVSTIATKTEHSLVTAFSDLPQSASTLDPNEVKARLKRLSSAPPNKLKELASTVIPPGAVDEFLKLSMKEQRKALQALVESGKLNVPA
jgi:hypothetical protein